MKKLWSRRMLWPSNFLAFLVALGCCSVVRRLYTTHPSTPHNLPLQYKSAPVYDSFWADKNVTPKFAVCLSDFLGPRLDLSPLTWLQMSSVTAEGTEKEGERERKREGEWVLKDLVIIVHGLLALLIGVYYLDNYTHFPRKKRKIKQIK